MPRVLTLKIWHPDCWAIDVTEELAGVRLEAKTMFRSSPYNVAEERVYGEEADVRAFQAMTEGDARIVQNRLLEAPSPVGPARFYTKYWLQKSLMDLLFAHDLYPVDLMWVADGYDFCKAVAPHDEGLNRFLEETESDGYHVAAVAAQPLTAENGGRPADAVTRRQLEVARRALDMGYYSWPRQASGKDLACRLGVSPPTVLEHLRKFESRVVRDYLEGIRRRRQKPE